MTSNENLGKLAAGESASIYGEVVHVSDPTVDFTEPANGRTGRRVTLFVETDESPAAVDSGGNPTDDRTFAELTEGTDVYRNAPQAEATPAAQRPDTNL